MTNFYLLLGCTFFGSLGYNFDSFNFSNLGVITLIIMLFCLGLVSGEDLNFKKIFLDGQNFITITSVIFGTFFGSWFCSIFIFNFTFEEILAASAGLGFYSYATVVVQTKFGLELGFITFLVNFGREFLGMAFAGFFSRFFGVRSLTVISASASDSATGIYKKYMTPELLVDNLLVAFILTLLIPLFYILI